MTPDAARRIVGAGGRLVVMPHSDAEVIRAAKQEGARCIPGAATRRGLCRARRRRRRAELGEALPPPCLKAWKAVFPPPCRCSRSAASRPRRWPTTWPPAPPASASAPRSTSRVGADEVGRRAAVFVHAWRARRSKPRKEKIGRRYSGKALNFRVIGLRWVPTGHMSLLCSTGWKSRALYSIRDAQTMDLARSRQCHRGTRDGCRTSVEGASERAPKVVAMLRTNASGKSNVSRSLLVPRIVRGRTVSSAAGNAGSYLSHFSGPEGQRRPRGLPFALPDLPIQTKPMIPGQAMPLCLRESQMEEPEEEPSTPAVRDVHYWPHNAESKDEALCARQVPARRHCGRRLRIVRASARPSGAGLRPVPASSKLWLS